MVRKRFWCFLTLVCFLEMAIPTSADEVSPKNPSASEEGFEAVDLDKVSSVNGKAHTIAAFAIVMFVLLLYSYSLLRREKVIKKDLEKLLERLQKHPPA